jgi:hypothetical protein
VIPLASDARLIPVYCSVRLMSQVLDRLFQQAIRKLKAKGYKVDPDDFNSGSFVVIRPNGFPVDSPSGGWQFSKMDVIRFSENGI